MPMPEMPIEVNFLVSTTSNVWIKDRENCYAAGKADALPPWPPEEGKVFVIGKGLNFCGQVLGRWNGTNWDRRLDIPGEKWFSDEPSDGITAAYLLGELEEVK